MENEKIISVIKKVLELSKNNPSKEEAEAAALKAQELLAKYHIDIAEVEGIDLDEVEQINEVKVDVPAKKWKYRLAKIVANNFRCKHFYYGKGVVVFYGHSTDAQVASETFKYLFKYGDKLGNRERGMSYSKNNGDVRGVYNSFVTGFCDGIEEVLAKQCTALALIVPEDVKTSYAEMAKGFKIMHTHNVGVRFNNACMSAYQNGKNEGRYAMGSRQLE